MKLEKTARGYRVDFYHPISHLRIRRVFRARTTTEAKQIAEQYRLSLLATAGVQVTGGAIESQCVDSAINAYFEQCSIMKSASSQTTDAKALKGLAEVIGSMCVNRLNQSHVAAYVKSEFYDKRLKASSVNRRLNSIKHFLGWCFQNRWLEHDLAKLVHHVKGPMRESRPLTDAELKAILAQAGDELKLQIQIASTFGLRAGEVASLEWSSIDFDRGTVRVGGTGSFATKSGQAKTLCLTPDLRFALSERKRTHPWVFPNERGDGPIDRELITKAWIRARKRAHLTDMKFHDLRATAGTRLAELGLGDAVIARVLGHSTAQMARKYSNKVSDDIVRRGVLGVEESLSTVFGQNTVRVVEPGFSEVS